MQELWAHQKEAIEKAKTKHNYALFFEMGAGKSRTALEMLRYRFNSKGLVLRTLIVCPPMVIPNWRDEWLKFTKINPEKVIPLYGSGKKRIETIIKAIEKDPQVIFITNYESLLMKDLFKLLQTWAPQAIVFDESHKCKSITASRSKLAYILANPTKDFKPHTYLLSGSPVLNSPMDIFQQFKIMDGGRTFGHNFFGFRARYFRDRNAAMPKDRYFPNWEVMTKAKDGFDAVSEINELIFASSMRVEKKDCLDLPPEVSVPIKVEMSREQRRLYEELKTDLVTYFHSRACVASLAITKALRLMQIASGFVSTVQPGEEDGPIEVELKSTPKREALKELLQELCIEQKKKVLVWAVFKHNYKTIAEVFKELGLDFVEVHGGISEAQKRKNVERFKSDSNCFGFMGHPGSGGIGINLVVAPYSIFYSRTFSLEHYLQARARNHRGGAKEEGHSSITHYDLICSNTIEELAVKKLASKQDMSEKLLKEIVNEIQTQKL